MSFIWLTIQIIQQEEKNRIKLGFPRNFLFPEFRGIPSIFSVPFPRKKSRRKTEIPLEFREKIPLEFREKIPAEFRENIPPEFREK